jgi:hypothetical protein
LSIGRRDVPALLVLDMKQNLLFAFQQQSQSCDALGSRFMADLMALMPKIWPEGTQLDQLFRDWPGEVGSLHASLPLRLAAGLHALVMSGQTRNWRHFTRPIRPMGQSFPRP